MSEFAHDDQVEIRPGLSISRFGLGTVERRLGRYLAGCRSSKEVRKNTAAFDQDIPDDVWTVLSDYQKRNAE